MHAVCVMIASAKLSTRVDEAMLADVTQKVEDQALIFSGRTRLQINRCQPNEMIARIPIKSFHLLLSLSRSSLACDASNRTMILNSFNPLAHTQL